MNTLVSHSWVKPSAFGKTRRSGRSMMTVSRRWTVKGRVCADGKPYDHWPAGQAKQPVALQIGQCEETGAERNRDAVVRIAAKDTHQQHQEVAVFEIFIGNTGILRNEERDDASGRESHDGCFVSVEKIRANPDRTAGQTWPCKGFRWHFGRSGRCDRSDRPIA